MEESKQERRRISRRSKLSTAIAAAALLAVITGAAVAISNSDNSGNVRTVDSKPKENVSTSTTVPLSVEEQLLSQGVIIERTFFSSSANEGVPQNSTVSMRDGSTQKLVEEFDSFVKSANLFDPQVTYVGGGYLRLVSRVSYSCDEITSYYFNINTHDSFSSNTIRAYSPSGTLYSELSTGCGEDNSNIVRTLKIVNTKTNEIRTIKPEEYRAVEDTANFPGNVLTFADEVIWASDDVIAINVHTNSSNVTHWSVFNLSSKISLTQALQSEPVIGESEDDSIIFHDIRVVGDQTLVLMSERGESESEIYVRVQKTDGNVEWEKVLHDDGDWLLSTGLGLKFGVTTDSFSGAEINTNEVNSVTRPFIYDRSRNTIYRPDGALYFTK